MTPPRKRLGFQTSTEERLLKRVYERRMGVAGGRGEEKEAKDVALTAIEILRLVQRQNRPSTSL
eukprot:1004149-Rhodomonas_salina.2